MRGRGVIGIALVLGACDLARDPQSPDATPDADEQFPYPPPRGDLVPPIGGDATLEIATWNLENFPANAGTPSAVADAITSLALDLVVVEEIASVTAWDELLARLREHDGVLSTHQYAPGSYQKIGIIYRTPMIAVGAPTLLFVEDGYNFPRPALSVPITIDGARTIEVIGIHLKAGVGFDDGERRRRAVEQIDAHLR